MTDLELFDALPIAEQSAFLALFAGARGNLMLFRRGDTGTEEPPFFGKYECEVVPFREFWQVKTPALGWTTFAESEPRPALGMIAGSTVTDIEIGITERGEAVREAYWTSVREAIDRQEKQATDA